MVERAGGDVERLAWRLGHQYRERARGLGEGEVLVHDERAALHLIGRSPLSVEAVRLLAQQRRGSGLKAVVSHTEHTWLVRHLLSPAAGGEAVLAAPGEGHEAGQGRVGGHLEAAVAPWGGCIASAGATDHRQDQAEPRVTPRPHADAVAEREPLVPLGLQPLVLWRIFRAWRC